MHSSMRTLLLLQSSAAACSKSVLSNAATSVSRSSRPVASIVKSIAASARYLHVPCWLLKDDDAGAAFTYSSPATQSTNRASASSARVAAGPSTSSENASLSGSTVRRISRHAIGGALQPSADAEQIKGERSSNSDTSITRPTSASALLPRATRQTLSPMRIVRGTVEAAATMDRALHEKNKGKLNHSLAAYIEKAADWKSLLPLIFEHMHHMTNHNYVRSLGRLMKLSSTRVVLDPMQYNMFGRFMVQVETKLADLNTLGLMDQVFIPYHYLRRCLKQMRVLQQRAVDREKADPEHARFLRREARLEREAAKDTEAANERLDETVRDTERKHRDKYNRSRRDDKTGKLRARELRAGRTFVSVHDTIRRRTGHASKYTSTTNTDA